MTTPNIEELRGLVDAVSHCAMSYAQNQFDKHASRRLSDAQKALLDALQSQAERIKELDAKMVPLEKDADMFWDHDDAERNYNSIDEFLNEEICSGMGVEVGGEFTMRRAISLPNIKIRVTSIDEEACEAEYEIIPSGITGEPK